MSIPAGGAIELVPVARVGWVGFALISTAAAVATRGLRAGVVAVKEDGSRTVFMRWPSCVVVRKAGFRRCSV